MSILTKVEAFMDDKYDDILITQKQIEYFIKGHGLRKVLSGVHLWGIGVGTAIAGVFLGWNYGLEYSGSFGFFIATIIVTIFYVIITVLFAKLSSLIPYAGGPYAYARKGLGSFFGFLTGMITFIEFFCAASAVILSIVSYLSTVYPSVPTFYITISVYIMFLIIDIIGIKQSAILQLIITIIAISALILFFIGTSGSIHITNVFSKDSFLNGGSGILSSIPYAIWFYVCMEGITLAAEETKDPQKNILWGFISSIITLVTLNITILFISITCVKWKLLLNNNAPLLFVLKSVKGIDPISIKVFTALTICALFASLHGMMNGYSREIFALSRAGYLPKLLSKIHPVTKTPYLAIIIPGLLCILSSYKLNLKLLIFFSGFSAILMYILIIGSYIFIKGNEVAKYNKNVWFKKTFLFLALIIFLLLYVEIYLFQHTPYSFWMGVILISLVIYYLLFGRKFIMEDAPEETEAKINKI